MSGRSLADLHADGALQPERKAEVDAEIAKDPRYRTRWWWRGRPEQLWPDDEAWGTWLVMAGRGFGKTRSGAEWVRMMAADPAARIALVGATLHEARAVMVEGVSGVLAVCEPDGRPDYEPSKRLVRWKSGAEARLYSADDPDSLRGGQHSHAWGDEIAKWAHGAEAWMNLRMGLRLGSRPRAVLTTTPRPVSLVKALVADAAVAKSLGATADNAANLAPGFVAALTEAYGGTRFGRQELDGALIEDVEGALWTRAMLEACRVKGGPLSPLADGESPSPRKGEGWGEGSEPGTSLRRIVVAVDPPASSHGDACGIVVAGLGADGRGYVLADLSVEKAAPAQWAAAVHGAAEAYGADRVVAEANNGGDMVASVLAGAGLAMPVKLVRASRGKSARAEPVAALYAAGRVRHCGGFPALEDEMCGLVTGGGYEGPGRSPDRADALVWALTELMLGAGEKRVGIRVL